jgi:aspartate/methionine/tyrosine aminotransferase
MMERVQVNLNSFASTYGQVAAEVALGEAMDRVAAKRASDARANLVAIFSRLGAIPSVAVAYPAGGYFLFADFSAHAPLFASLGYATAADFLLHEARVAVLAGAHFAEGIARFRHHVRINCGRAPRILDEACDRIAGALARMAAAA